MESTAINSVYVVMGVNMEKDTSYLMKVFGNEQDALKYKEECYKNKDEIIHYYYIMEEIVY